jgi:hypothetical protein
MRAADQARVSRMRAADDTPGVPTDTPRLEHVRVNVSHFDRAGASYESILELRASVHWPPDAPK